MPRWLNSDSICMIESPRCLVTNLWCHRNRSVSTVWLLTWPWNYISEDTRTLLMTSLTLLHLLVKLTANTKGFSLWKRERANPQFIVASSFLMVNDYDYIIKQLCVLSTTSSSLNHTYLGFHSPGFGTTLHLRIEPKTIGAWTAFFCSWGWSHDCVAQEEVPVGGRWNGKVIYCSWWCRYVALFLNLCFKVRDWL